ncbi:MAG: hypothetical protein BWK75_06870 [Candidatus Altiarchaeales archaeon A3]|nr:MAG: hypothetical protein BWK75_06870 [Candidatus Altiarchaeales archaeon A3]
MKKNLLIGLLVFVLFGLIGVQADEIHTKKIYVVDIDDTITSATTEIIKEAVNEKPDIIILRLNTPGGDLDSTLEIIQIIDNSEIPFVGYVSPKGAHAWSAGTFILLSTHIAAMSPNSIIGSCQPVYIGADKSIPINESKILNAVTAVMNERMNMYGRNFSLTEKFIIENLNLNADDARKFNAIELIADNENDLIEKINGMSVHVSSGEKTIITKNAEIVHYEPSIKTKFMSVLLNPLIASLLLMLGIYALIFGLSSPGMGAEILGILCILLGLIGLGFDVNLTGIALLILGIALIIYELSTQSFGIVGGVGVIALITGIILFGPLSSPNFYVSQEFFNTLLYSIIFPSVIFAVFLVFAVTKIFKSLKKKPVIGESMIGETAESTEDFENNTGFVMCKGELWKAKNLSKTNEKILKGDKVKIKEMEEYTLIVEKIWC